MNPFESLVKRAARQWGGKRVDLAAFPRVATRLLTEFEYGLRKDQLDRFLAGWFQNGRELPEQVSIHNTFGQPPITLFNDGRVVIDLYLWVTADTSIHSHGFRGAFRVLHGRSLHETFRVKVSQRIATGVMRCDPGLPAMSILEPGDVRTIQPGVMLTHRVIHLEKPTVTLCVKTINEPDLYQWEYYPDGLAVQRRDLDPGLSKRIYYFEYLLGQDSTQALRFLAKLVRGLSVVLRMTLYEALCGGAFDLSEEAIEHCLAQIRKHHGKEAWFKRYEFPAQPQHRELQFTGVESPLGRLVAHFINAGYDRKSIEPHLLRLTGRELSKADIQRVVISLLEFEPIFHAELAIDDRGVIKQLIEQPGRKIPEELESFGQIQRMRDFVGLFA